MTSLRHALLTRTAAGLAVAGLALTACSSADTGSTTTTGPTTASTAKAVTEAEEIANAGKSTDTSFCGTKQITLGIQDGFGVNAWSQASMAAVRSEAAKCSNVKQLVSIGEGDLQKSISQVNSMVTQGANAIVMIPDFGQAELPAIKAATAAGVQVVPWGADPSGAPGKDYVSYVDWKSADAGTAWAQWMVKALNGKGKIVMLGGPAGNPVTAAQLKSVVEVLKQNTGIELLTGNSDWAVTNWDPSQAQQVMGALLAKYPQIDGVISDYGTDALAAARAFQAANRPLVPVGTLEANGLGCLFQDSKSSAPKFQLATISSRNWLGRIAARKAIAAAAGVANAEPSTFSLPLIEDSTAGSQPVCQQSLGADFYNSNKIDPADLAKYGKP